MNQPRWLVRERHESFITWLRFVRARSRTVGKERAGARGAGYTAHLAGTSSDATRLERRAQRVDDGEVQLRGLFESMDRGFCVIDMLYDEAGRAFDYRFVEVNPAFEKHTGLADAVGRTVLEMVPDHEPFWFETYGRVASSGKSTRFVHRAEALERWYDVDAFRLEGVPRARVAVLFEDISERVEAQAARDALMTRLLEQDARRRDFLATLAHELRNPLAPLRSGLRRLARPTEDHAWGQTRAMMERQVELLVRLTDDLLDIERVNRGKLVLRRAPVALADVVRRAAEISQPLIDRGDHTLVLELPCEPVVLDADEVRLAQVVSNLLSNAAKYSERGSRIVLSAALADEGRDVEVRVRDQGIGIAPEMVSRVFDLYMQVDPSLEKAQGGLGVGLTLARNLVELHGGSLQARSEGLGHGSEFIVTLPLPPIDPAAGAVVTTDAMTPAAARRRILIADDNVDAADSLAALLRIHGHDVLTAYDGRSAIEQCEARRPDLVLLDLGMPGLGGLEACRAMRALDWGRQARIVALTGWGDELAQRRCRDAGFDGWLIKPVDDAALEQTLSELPPS